MRSHEVVTLVSQIGREICLQQHILIKVTIFYTSDSISESGQQYIVVLIFCHQPHFFFFGLVFYLYCMTEQLKSGQETGGGDCDMQHRATCWLPALLTDPPGAHPHFFSWH